YVRELAAADGPRRGAQLALALREPPASYLGDLDRETAREHFLDLLAASLNALLARRPLTLVGCVMHTGFDDSDDHVMYARLRTRLRDPERLRVAPGRHSLQDVVRAFRASQGAFAVRFHAMILALATETPFVAVDYARPAGKVSAAAELAGVAAQVMPWDSLESAELLQRLESALDTPVTVPNLESARRARLD